MQKPIKDRQARKQREFGLQYGTKVKLDTARIEPEAERMLQDPLVKKAINLLSEVNVQTHTQT